MRSSRSCRLFHPLGQLAEPFDFDERPEEYDAQRVGGAVEAGASGADLVEQVVCRVHVRTLVSSSSFTSSSNNAISSKFTKAS